MNFVFTSFPRTPATSNFTLTWLLLKSPVRSWSVTSTVRPGSFSDSSARVSPTGFPPKRRGDRMVYHCFARNVSRARPAARRFFFPPLAMSL